ncbi:MAG: hypothetical protein GY898_27545 [Proteobacteria bacterium]|nr:hypothetical protein [Pseudomonadota bacterium]
MRTFPGCILPLLAAGALSLSACDPEVPTGSVDGACDDVTVVDEANYDAEIGPLFETYCVFCHDSEKLSSEDRRGAVPGVDYDTLDASAQFPSLTWSRLADQTMPPMGRMPSTEELETLLEFLNCAEATDVGDDDDSAL